MTNSLHNALNVVLCQNAEDAIAKGYNFAAQPETYQPIEIEKVVIVRDGTVGHRPTVDFILKAPNGQLYVCMLTGRLVQMVQQLAGAQV